MCCLQRIDRKNPPNISLLNPNRSFPVHPQAQYQRNMLKQRQHGHLPASVSADALEVPSVVKAADSHPRNHLFVVIRTVEDKCFQVEEHNKP